MPFLSADTLRNDPYTSLHGLTLIIIYKSALDKGNV